MKISELILEQTIGTTGSTTSTPGQVGTVSQTPAPAATTPTTDPNVQKLAATLKQNKIIDTDKQVNDFMAAKMATDTGKPLTAQQQAVMAKLGPAVLKNKTLDQNLDLLLKTMSAQKPGQPATTTPMGSTPPPTIK